MGEIFNPLDANKWKSLLAEFDRKRIEFANAVQRLRTQSGADPALEQRRAALLSKAGAIQGQIDLLMKTATSIRDWLKGFGISLGGQFGAFPIIALGVGLAGAAAIIAGINGFLGLFLAWDNDNKRRKAGWSEDEIVAAKTAKTEPEFFGIKVGGWKGLAILAGIIIAGPFIMRELQKRF